MRSIFKNREKGVILFLVVLFISIFFLLTVPFLIHLTAKFRLTEKSYRSLAALNLAEAGVERAIWEVNHGDISSWAGDQTERSIVLSSFRASSGNDIGDVEIKVLNPRSENPVVIARGSVREGKKKVDRTVKAVLAHGFESFFNFGIFGDKGFNLHGNVHTDSYNSLLGSYDPLHPGSYGDVGTNATDRGNVALLNNTVVNGNVITGYQTDPQIVVQLKNNARITGVWTALEQPKRLPVYEPPASLPERGHFRLAAGSSEVEIRESGQYSSFIMDSNTAVSISGKVMLYIKGPFLMSGNSQMNITPGSDVEIVLGSGIFEQHSHSAIHNLTQNPKKLAILGTSEFHTMVWRSNTDFYGVIYAPAAHIDYNANHDFYGSLVGRYLTVSSQSGIHYDEALAIWKKYSVKSQSYVLKSLQKKF
ncbi:MAG: hypothetical protein WCC06_11945 [Candidatus Aminicenantales bacterium]